MGREIVGYQDGTHPGWRCHIHLARYLSEEPRCSFGIEVVESSSGLARASVLITSFRTSDGRESSISRATEQGFGGWLTRFHCDKSASTNVGSSGTKE